MTRRFPAPWKAEQPSGLVVKDASGNSLAQTFVPKVVDTIIAEMMDSYRRQVDPPSRAVQ